MRIIYSIKVNILSTRERKRTEPNSNRLFENSVEPNRTRTDFFKVKSNRTELEPYLKKMSQYKQT